MADIRRADCGWLVCDTALELLRGKAGARRLSQPKGDDRSWPIHPPRQVCLVCV